MSSRKEPPQQPPPGDEAHLEVHDDGFEDSLQRRYWIVWWTTLITPFALTVAVPVLLYIVKGGPYVHKLLAVAVATFFFFGRFVILGGNDTAASGASDFGSSEELFLMVVFLDLITAMLLAFHISFLFKVPLLGVKLRQLSADGRMILQAYPWMRRTTIVGVIAFVMFPIAATGSVGGSILGRMLGLSRLTAFTCVMIGSALGCGVMYFGAELITAYLPRENPLVAYGGVGVIVVLILFLNMRYRKMKAQRSAEIASDGERE